MVESSTTSSGRWRAGDLISEPVAYADRIVKATDVSESSHGRRRPGRLTLVFGIVVGVGLLIGQLLGITDEEVSSSVGRLGPMVGGPAPPAEMMTFDGQAWSLAEHLASDGRPVILNLWASWCAPCRFEIPELSAFADLHPEILVVGIAVQDTEAEARKLADDLQPRYLVGLDSSGSLLDRYSGFGLPMTFLIDSDGIVRSQLMGGVTLDTLETEMAGIS